MGLKFKIQNSKFKIFLPILLLLTLVACGKEGPPLPPEIRIAERTGDLKAYQEGEVAVLQWSYPSMTTAGQTLTDVEAIEVWRATLPKGQEPPPPMTPQDRALQRQLLEAQGEILQRLDPPEIEAATRGKFLVYRDDLTRWREDAAVEPWQARAEELANRIQRLGPINLAAIDEFEEQSERMAYLDSQHEDISKSLETLEEAIRKIDRETRTRFKETFDRVDSGFKDLFPKLFGGGHAYLELTGEDLLDTGVTVMARPPGKRNSSIHLLSGGEKALTAVALVFAIFRLNPAPFCMLDEVDAPLDDANVGRYSALVREMSEHVQFIFITHNKVTMEVANHLTGVTMHEPGVSRLVSVDVEQAAALAAV